MDNRTLVRTVIDDVYNNRDLSKLCLYCAENYVFHDSLALTTNLGDLRRVLEDYYEAFSDSRCVIEAQTSDGELVATRLVAIATHTCTFLGRPATGRKRHLTGIQVDRVRDGRLLETWVQMDYIAAVQQVERLPHIEVPRAKPAVQTGVW